jgi:hypothetical protein
VRRAAIEEEIATNELVPSEKPAGVAHMFSSGMSLVVGTTRLAMRTCQRTVAEAGSIAATYSRSEMEGR